MLWSENGVRDVGMHDFRPLNYGNLTSIQQATLEKHLNVFGIWLGPILSPASRAAVVRLMSRKVPGHGWLLYCVVVPTGWLTLTPHDADHKMQSHMHGPTHTLE